MVLVTDDDAARTCRLVAVRQLAGAAPPQQPQRPQLLQLPAAAVAAPASTPPHQNHSQAQTQAQPQPPPTPSSDGRGLRRERERQRAARRRDSMMRAASMPRLRRHLDKGSDLLEEAASAGPGAGPGAGPAAGEAPRSASSGGLRELARSLKQHLLGFSERLEDTRERLEDTSRCFCLLDKAYEWALETMKYMSRVKADDAQTPEQTLQQLTRLRQYLMAHPPVPDDHFQEMLALARKLANDKLLEQAKVAHARCQETMELIREQQARLVRTRQQLGLEDDEVPFSPSHGSPPAAAPASAAAAPSTPSSQAASDGARPASPRDAPLGWSPASAPAPAAASTPLGAGAGGAIGRRRSVGSFPYIYKCSHHAAGHACACWDATLPPAGLDDSAASATAAAGECTCGPRTRPNNLGDIREVRESAEDLLEDAEAEEAGGPLAPGAGPAAGEKGDGRVCGRCGGTTPGAQQLPATAQSAQTHKRYLRRSCTWQYPTEGFDEEDTLCDGGDGHIADSTTDGSDGCPKGSEDLEDQEGVANKSVPPVPVNSHLHCHASSLDLQASLQNASTKDLKIQKTLLLILREMIQTERDYVKSLEYVIENYIPELMREDIPQALRGQRNVIFGNIEKIFEFHSQYFLQELERCENSPLHVGQCFLRHEKKFYLYALYNKNKPKSDSLMSEYGSSFFKAKQLELGDKMDLASYLLKPVQRMGKYALLLQQLMKAYPEKEADVTDIKAAEQMVRFQLRHGNDLLAMDSLRDCDVNVKEQGRLLRQNEFLVWQGKGKKCLRQVFLFEELILFSKARRFPDRKNLDLYIYKNSIKMTDIGLTAKIGDSPTKFEIWFRKRKPNDTFTLQSMSEEIKQAWTEEISKLLWKQALRNREMRLAEMSSMGIGNKPCLDIRPSADQISDRSISIAQLSKTAPRFRNSISVSSGELLRSNKRPHSIISVSSSSSGGSSSSSTSHSSGSTYGALVNLGFDPADSPRMHHRSTTLHSQCSTESGIIADISLGSDDTDGCSPHWHVERSNSSVTSMSLDSSMSPTSPVSPSEENKTCLHPPQPKDDNCASRTNDNETDQEELSVKL
ncbi:hypothetical protein R5R35_008808 [Gryllus longicercus]|uniref:Puratrophin-1 n=1 Tax=Gryllus longicercus TaxID=2509291 RepID=A0AAN9V8R8_9ORTH